MMKRTQHKVLRDDIILESPAVLTWQSAEMEWILVDDLGRNKNKSFFMTNSFPFNKNKNMIFFSNIFDKNLYLNFNIIIMYVFVLVPILKLNIYYSSIYKFQYQN